MAKKKSWSEKLRDDKGLPKVVTITPKMAERWGNTGDTVVIPKPMEVDEIMRRVPVGKVITINQIREAVARKHKAGMGCPITCGIFARIAAEVAAEEMAQGKKDITPYWRTIKSDGSINEKYPGDLRGQKEFLEAEGHKVVQKGKKYIVVDYQKTLAKV